MNHKIQYTRDVFRKKSILATDPFERDLKIVSNWQRFTVKVTTSAKFSLDPETLYVFEHIGHTGERM